MSSINVFVGSCAMHNDFATLGKWLKNDLRSA